MHLIGVTLWASSDLGTMLFWHNLQDAFHRMEIKKHLKNCLYHPRVRGCPETSSISKHVQALITI